MARNNTDKRRGFRCPYHAKVTAPNYAAGRFCLGWIFRRAGPCLREDAGSEFGWPAWRLVCSSWLRKIESRSSESSAIASFLLAPHQPRICQMASQKPAVLKTAKVNDHHVPRTVVYPAAPADIAKPVRRNALIKPMLDSSTEQTACATFLPLGVSIGIPLLESR